MKVCSLRHDEICYDVPYCPMCDKNEDIRMLEDKIVDLEYEIEMLRDKVCSVDEEKKS